MTGSPEPTAEWLKNGAPIVLGRRIKADVIGDMCQLSFTETLADDRAEYKCVARNDVGSASTECELIVIKPISSPEFIVKLKTVNVNEGETAQFDVKATGHPEPKIEWLRGSQAIDNEGRCTLKRGEEDGQHSLIIDDTTTDDAGTYKCVASNTAGKATCRGELNVSEKLTAPEFVGDLVEAPITFNEGDEVSLTVTILGKPSPEVQWYKDELNVSKSSNVNTLVKGDQYTLTIYSAKPSDSGVYKCVAKSKMGTATRTFTIHIEGEFVANYRVKGVA